MNNKRSDREREHKNQEGPAREYKPNVPTGRDRVKIPSRRLRRAKYPETVKGEFRENLPRRYDIVGEPRLEGFTPRIGMHTCTHVCDCDTDHTGAGESLPVPVYYVENTAVDALGHFYYVPDGADQVVAVPLEGEEGGLVALEGLSLGVEEILAHDHLSLNLIYFPRAYCFHPGAVVEDASTVLPFNPYAFVASPNSSAVVMTVDSGVVGGYKSGQVPDFVGGTADSWSTDAITGHGPAIADLIGQSVGSEQSLLTRVDYQHGAVGVGYTFNLHGKLVRGFDTDSLHRTLHALWNRSGDRPSFSVLNLSLGAVGCPEVVANDPVGAWIEAWLDGTARDDHPMESRSVVVAAGNHGNCVRSWPAAYAETWGEGLRLYSVGSGTESQPDLFSARGPWVNKWENGTAVRIKHPKFTEAVWTGTSFAAPQLAAKLATGRV